MNLRIKEIKTKRTMQYLRVTKRTETLSPGHDIRDRHQLRAGTVAQGYVRWCKSKFQWGSGGTS